MLKYLNDTENFLCRKLMRVMYPDNVPRAFVESMDTVILAKEVWALYDYKEQAFKAALKRHKVNCVYGIPEYNNICDDIYVRFVTVFEHYRNLVSKRPDRYMDMTTIGAFLYTLFGGWVERYCKSLKMGEKA